MIQRGVFYLFNLLIFFVFNLHKIMVLRPQSVHQWRQCDSAAYCLNYFQNNDSNFFFPQVMSQMAFKGHAISEFPIIYWLSGKLYKIFGYNEAIPRLLSYAIFIVGIIFLFEMGYKFFKNKWWALFPVLVAYSSPVLVYYALNYLPNVPAFALSLGTWYFFFRYIDSRNLKDIFWCSFLALLAGLLKPIELFNYMTIFGILFIEYVNPFNYFNRSEGEKYVYSKKELRIMLGCFVSVLALNFFWVLYAKGYAHAFGFYGNLLGILPIWDMSSDKISQTVDRFQWGWAYQLFYPYAFALLVIFLIVVRIFYKRVNPYLHLALIFSIICQLLYIVLFFDVFYHHDYYMVNIFIVPIFIVIAFIQIVESFDFKKYQLGVLVVCVLFFVVTLKHSRNILYERYFGALQEGINPNLQTITPYLRSIGINREDLVISVPDNSPNVSLYLMNQVGWTNSYVLSPEALRDCVNKGGKYLIVNNQNLPYTEWYLDYMKNQIGEYNGIKIFKLQ